MSIDVARDFLWIATIFYSVAVIIGFAGAYFRKSNLFKQVTLLGIILGFVLQTRGLFLRGLETNGCPW